MIEQRLHYSAPRRGRMTRPRYVGSSGASALLTGAVCFRGRTPPLRGPGPGHVAKPRNRVGGEASEPAWSDWARNAARVAGPSPHLQRPALAGPYLGPGLVGIMPGAGSGCWA